MMRTTGFSAGFTGSDIGEVSVEDEGGYVVLEQNGEQVWIPRDEFGDYLAALREWATANVEAA